VQICGKSQEKSKFIISFDKHFSIEKMNNLKKFNILIFLTLYGDFHIYLNILGNL